MKRKSKEITNPKEIELIVNIKEEDITTSFIMEMFGKFDNEPRYHPYDLIKIPKDSYGPDKKKNKESFITTIGLWIFNKYFIEKDLFHIFQYITETVDDGLFGKINKQLSYALNENRITVDQLKTYLKKTQKCMPYVHIFSPNHTEKMLTITEVVNKKKDELITKYKDEIEAGNEVIGEKIEKELLDYAVEQLGDDPSMDLFLSGARGSLGNNFKNMFVMKGVIADPDPNAKQKYHIATSNYMDGIKPEEFTLFANSLAAGPYSRSNKTAEGGYLEKLFLAALQHLVLDEDSNSDCGTTGYIEVLLDKKNIEEFMYCFVIERGGKLVEITSENMNNYIGKKVKMRYITMCKSKTGICSRCAGTLYYRTGKTNIGTATTKIPSTLKNISMKAFHDSVQRLTEMDIDRAFNID
ncbi:MAG: hypothetical protein PHC62_00945 [Candidatus Izemoplasmatales bacterium]|nr:hypothetical protein [Candidatus Izemoplasmatales bacterium]